MNQKLLYQWSNEIAKNLAVLNTWQVEILALFSQGIIRAESCQQQQIARQVTCGERVDSAARRMCRFLDNATFPLEAFYSEWTNWIFSGLASDYIYLLVDETKLEDRFPV